MLKKAESSENLAENELLKSGLKEFEIWTFEHWNDLNLLEKKADLFKCLKKVTSPTRKNESLKKEMWDEFC